MPAEEIQSRLYRVSATLNFGGQGQLRIFSLVEDVCSRYRDLNKIKNILARVLQASGRNREDIKTAPTPHYLQLAEKLLFVWASTETDEAVKAGKLAGLDPVWEGGCWSTRGRLRKALPLILGRSSLPILLRDSRLAYLIMVSAHEEDHREAKITLARS